MGTHPLQYKFVAYHAKNPIVYKCFDRFTRRMIEQGAKHGSPWLLMNRIRWELEVEVDSNEHFKIPNGYFAFYSRLWEYHNPEHAGFFRKRDLEHTLNFEWVTVKK